jgi:hypothetical protein
VREDCIRKRKFKKKAAIKREDNVREEWKQKDRHRKGKRG